MKPISEQKKIIEAATPGPWQQSRFAPQTNQEMSKELRVIYELSEARVIRGPGVIGTPECNVVMRLDYVTNEADQQFIIEARTAYSELLDWAERAWWALAKCFDVVGPNNSNVKRIMELLEELPLGEVKEELPE